MANTGTAAALTISELREFANFTASEQRYIKRSLDIGLGRHDALKRWARDAQEIASIRAQYAAYQDIPGLRGSFPEDAPADDACFGGLDDFMGQLLRLTAFDLAQERLECFSAYRFLYERLMGASVRPWLPSAFCAAAALPHIRPDRRKTLLHSISEAAAMAPAWSMREPCFYPEWVEKEAA